MKSRRVHLRGLVLLLHGAEDAHERGAERLAHLRAALQVDVGLLGGLDDLSHLLPGIQRER